ncbi:MAG TPA: FecR family protein [Candidatus Binataceae bacterium]|nr:FecR family protein [Candidatus Binataceae bacterium]
MRACNPGRFARLHLVIMLALMLAAACAPRAAFAQAAVAGSITTSSGQVSIQRGAATIGGAVGVAVEVGDRIITGPNGHVIVRLSDQSTLELGASSNIVVDQQTSSPVATRINLFRGELRSFVNHTLGAAAPNFQIHTPNAVAAARGTRFDTVYSSGVARPTFGDCHNFTDVAVQDGVVNLANAGNPGGGVNVRAGYEATVPCFLSPTGAGPLGMTGASSFTASSGGGNSSLGVISPVVPVPPPACPICVGPATGGGPKPPPVVPPG